MKMPPSYGVGLSYRHSDAWLVAFDLYHTQWSRFSISDAKGNEINPLDGRLLSEGRLENTTQVRFGTEYLFIKDRYVIPVRAGLFYDPEPSKNKTDKFYGISFGSGYSTQKFSLDASYQYRFGNNTTGDIPSVEGSRADIKQHTAMLSLIWYLK
jgi:long-subunit fatty acid transport protein